MVQRYTAFCCNCGTDTVAIVTEHDGELVRLCDHLQELERLRGLLREAKSLASIGYHIGDADVRGYDKIGERWGKKQDELIVKIDAALEGSTHDGRK